MATTDYLFRWLIVFFAAAVLFGGWVASKPMIEWSRQNSQVHLDQRSSAPAPTLTPRRANPVQLGS